MEFITNTIEIRKSPVAVISLNGNAENSISKKSLLRLQELMQSLADSREAKGVIITSTNEKFFCGGLNLDTIAGSTFENISSELIQIIEFYYFLLAFPLPVISKIKGHALGAGAIIALGSDYRYMLDSHARIGFTEVHVGLALPNPIIEKLKFTVSPEILNDMVLLGKTLRPGPALENHLLHGIHKDEVMLDKFVNVKMKELLDVDENAFRWTKYTFYRNILLNREYSIEFIKSNLKNKELLENLLSKIKSFQNR